MRHLQRDVARVMALPTLNRGSYLISTCWHGKEIIAYIVIHTTRGNSFSTHLEDGGSDDMHSDAPNNVTEDDRDRRPAKRQRVSRACAPCRYAKLRCDGQQPTCTTCRQQDKRCTYEASLKRRGLRSGYVRALELLWGLTFHELENSELVVDELLGRLSKNDLTTSSDRTDSSSYASTLLDQWKQSNVSRHIDDLLDDNEEQNAGVDEEQAQDDLRQPHSGGSSRWLVVRSADFQLHQDQPEQPQLDVALSEAQQCLEPHTSNFESHHLQETNSNPQIPFYGPQLLQLFFQYVQSWLPILERHVTLRTAFQYSVDSSSLCQGDRAALWAVYAYISTILSHHLIDDHARQHAKTHCGAFYAQAYSMLPLDSDRPIELGHIQCVVLLALTRLSSGKTTAAWRLTKIGTQMLREMSEQQQQQPVTEHNALARVWLACFVIDTISSAFQKNVPSLHYNDVVGQLQIDENGVEEWQPWHRPGTWQNQDSIGPDTATDIPTHSVSMLMLQVKLLRFYSNPHLRDSSWQASTSELEQWNQDLSGYLARMGLTKILANKDLDLLVLPPSFVLLSITYTVLVNKAIGSNSSAGMISNATTRRIEYPLLSDAVLQSLREDDQFRRSFPAAYLVLTMFRADRSDGPRNILSNGPNDTWQQEPQLNNLVPEFGLSQLVAQSDQAEVNSQQQDMQVMTATDSNLGQSQDPIQEQGPGSEMPSVDSFICSADAPFLEFMDGLDDRSM